NEREAGADKAQDNDQYKPTPVRERVLKQRFGGGLWHFSVALTGVGKVIERRSHECERCTQKCVRYGRPGMTYNCVVMSASSVMVRMYLNVDASYKSMVLPACQMYRTLPFELVFNCMRGRPWNSAFFSSL